LNALESKILTSLGPPPIDDSFGYVLATGDFNGDGFADLAIGDPHDDTLVSNGGAVLIVYGSITGPDTSNRTLLRQGVGGVMDASEANDRFASSLAAGDFNGDSIDDLAVGVPGETFGTKVAAGVVMVFFGSDPTGLRTDNEELWHLDRAGIAHVAGNGDAFGAALAAGDFDGDGYGDIAIGAPWRDLSGVVNAGMVTVIRGSSTGMTNSLDQAVSQDWATMSDSHEALDEFGWSLAAGDFNNDGNTDLAIGVPGEVVSSQSGAGGVHLVFGHAVDVITHTGNAFWTGQSTGIGATLNDGWGRGGLASCDFNGDGYDDLAMGIPWRDNGGIVDAGMVFTAAGSPTLILNPFTPVQEFGPSSTANANFGNAVACGDFDDNGFSDLAVSSELYEGGGNPTDSGKVEVIYNTAGTLLGSGDWQYWDRESIGSAPLANDHFGTALATGDFDGGGHADLAIGVVSSVGADGEVHVLLGGTEFVDTDGDGLGNWEEEHVHLTDPLLADTDGDGLTDPEEVNTHGTDPNDADTDGDGLTDGDEVNIHGTDPNDADSDADGLSDSEEINTYSTDPLDLDTDNDGALDGEEIAVTTDPFDANSTPSYATYQYAGNAFTSAADPPSTTDSISGSITLLHSLGPNLVDFDVASSVGALPVALIKDVVWTDGFRTFDQPRGGSISTIFFVSTDGAGNIIKWETLLGDHLSVEIGTCNDASGVLGTTDECGDLTVSPFSGLGGVGDVSRIFLDPGYDLSFVVDNPGTWTTMLGASLDSDRDGLTNTEEVAVGTDPQNADSDTDGLVDIDEVNIHGTDPNDSDSDADGLTDGAEVNSYATDPLDPDSDHDGATDGAEIATGSDPLDSSSTPAQVAQAIDTFEDGDFSIVSDQILAQSGLTGIVGGVREAATGASTVCTVGGGVAALSFYGGASTSGALLNYDGLPNDAVDSELGSLNLDLTVGGADRFVIRIESAAGTVAGWIILSDADTASAIGTVPEFSSAGTVEVLFSEFSDIDFSDVRAIGLELFPAVPGGTQEISVSSFVTTGPAPPAAVPSLTPLGMAVLWSLLGLAACWRLRLSILRIRPPAPI
jgi:hypothetical protein